MGVIGSQTTSLAIVYSTIYSGLDQIKYQSSASLAFVWGIHPAQMASNVENVSIWWRHHVTDRFIFSRFASVALGQSYNCSSVADKTLKEMGKSTSITPQIKMWLILPMYYAYCALWPSKINWVFHKIHVCPESVIKGWYVTLHQDFMSLLQNAATNECISGTHTHGMQYTIYDGNSCFKGIFLTDSNPCDIFYHYIPKKQATCSKTFSTIKISWEELRLKLKPLDANSTF